MSGNRIIGLDGKPLGNVQRANMMIAGVGIGGARAQFHALRYQAKIASKPGDCGIDLYPCGIDKIDYVGNLVVYLTSTKFHLILPQGIYGRIVSRSSSIEKLNGGWVIDGTIDAGYTGEYFIRIAAHITPKDTICPVKTAIQACIDKDLALAQVILAPYALPAFTVIDPNAVRTGRGSDGFGSTDGVGSTKS